MRWGRFILLGLVFLTSLAQAANPKAAALIKEGDRLYKENKYREAAEALKKAYEFEPAPVLLYNIGRAYDQAGELMLALDGYRHFVGQEASDPALVKKANLAMDRLHTLVAREDAGKQVVDADKKRLEDEAAAAKGKAARYDAKDKAALAASQKKTNTRLLAAIIVGAVAVGALGAGIGFGLAAGGSKTSFLNATSVADKQRFEAETKTRSLIADLSFAAALATAITAVILVAKGGNPEPDGAVEVVLGPTVGGTFVGLGGRF